MGDSKIEYVTKTWNVCTGCTPDFSCWPRCWARAYHARWRKDFTPTFHPAKLDEPLHWRKPQRVAVAFLGDLFHDAITDEQIATVFGAMAACPQHTFFLVTKRTTRMREWFAWLAGITSAAPRIGAGLPVFPYRSLQEGCEWPRSNIWPGVSVEDQARADERLPDLMATPAAHRWVSLEPLIGPVDLSRCLKSRCRGCGTYSVPDLWAPQRNGHVVRRDEGPFLCGPLDRQIEWLVVGGESNQGGQPARPCDVAWIRSVVEQCRAAHVPVYLKQCGSHVRDRNDVGFSAEDEVFADGPDAGQPTEPQAWPTPADVEHDPYGYRQAYQGAPVRVHLHHPRGADPAEWPADLRVRELPVGMATKQEA